MTTTITPAVTQAIVALAAALGLIAIALLIGFLVLRELLSGSADARLRRAEESLTVIVGSLLVVFGFVIAFRIHDLWH